MQPVIFVWLIVVMEDFKAIGISFHNTPLDIREQVALNESETRELLLKLKEVVGLSESLVVSTCNRTEIYYSNENGLDKSGDIIALISSLKGVTKSVLQEYVYHFNSEEAVKHLFEVSVGLASQVLGDIQISNQVKKAYQASADLEMAGPFLHRLMHTIFFANKRVVQETRLQDGNASVASVAVELIKGFVDSISSPRVALIGLGEIGQNVLENLKALEDIEICLVNRTRAKAEKLADMQNISFSDMSELSEVIQKSDVIISAVSTNEPLIKKSSFNTTKLHHKLLIDLSVPRSISEDVERTPGVALYNVDQLTEKTQKARKLREKSIPDVTLIIDNAINGFEQWKSEMEVSPTINKLKNVLDQIRREELLRHSAKVTDKEMELLEVVTKSMIQKVIKLPVLQLKAACKRGESETLVGVLNDLFNLESDTVNKG